MALTKLGFRTCVIDANFTAPDLALHFGIIPEVTLWDVLKSKKPIDEALYEHACGLHIIPGSMGIEKFNPDIYKRLKRKMKGLRYDFIIIDTPPGLGEDAKAAIMPADEIILLANPEWTSIANAYRMLQFALDKKKKITGLVLNRVMAHEYEPDPRMVENLLGVYIMGKIPEDIYVRKSIAVQSPVVLVYPESRASREIMRIAMKLGGIEIKERKGILERIKEMLERLRI